MGLVWSITTYVKKIFREPHSKFKLEPGITLFDNMSSPCARRVRMMLLEKNIPYRKVEINLLKGEHLSSEYTRICPNKKVPAVAFQDVPGLEDCTLYESNVITELLDSDIFPGPKLYPVNAWERAQVKMWQDWELGLVDDFVPFVYANMLPFLLQLMHSSKEAFLATLPEETPPAKRKFWSGVYDASLSTPEELRQHAIICYQNLTVLEKALENQLYLVGNNYTAADLSVLPRVAMYERVGLYIPKATFPNIFEYLRLLGSRDSILNSEKLIYRLMGKLMVYFPDLVVRLGNWRSGRHLTRFDGSTCLERMLGEGSSNWSHHSGWLAEVDKLGWDCVLVADCLCYPECWQVKLILMEKGVDFKTHRLPVYNVVGRWAGSGGIICIHHNGHEVIGIRAVLDYIDACFASVQSLFPRAPLERARVQCWQAWDQTMGYAELAPLLEMKLVSKFLVREFSKNLPELYNLGKDPKHKSKFPSILRCFVSGLMSREEHKEVLMEMEREYREVVAKARALVEQQAHFQELLQDRLRHLEAELKGKVDVTFIQGKTLTAADAVVFVRLSFMQAVDVVPTGEYPTVSSWCSQLRETRPHFQAVSDNILKLSYL